MTVQIPNEVGTTLDGTPSPASIATESADGVAQAGIADHVQQVSLTNIFSELKYLLSCIGKGISTVVDASTGRLRLEIVDFNTENQPQQDAIPCIQIMSFSSVNFFGTNGTPANVLNGPGGSGQNSVIPTPYKPDGMIHDLIKIMWVESVKNWAVRT